MREGEDPSARGFITIHSEDTLPDYPKVLHALANKLLPIIAFSDLGIRNSQDRLLLSYFQKIRQAAGDARDMLVSLRLDLQEQERTMKSEQQISGPEKDPMRSRSTMSK